MDYSICLGTTGWGVWHSPDAGTSWTRMRGPFPLNSRIQALVAHPQKPHSVFAAGDTGLFVSHDGGANWERLGVQGDLPTIWSLAVDPVDPDIIFAGTRPAAVYRSRDGGRHWQQLDIDIAQECAIGTPFVTALVVDPDDHRIVWAGVEIDGVFRSMDGGDTFHALGTKDKWPLPYARGMAVRPDASGVLFAGCGESTTGERGYVLRTKDFGQRWETMKLPTEANATVWGLSTHPADANRIVAFTLLGEVYASEDAGTSWRKIAREFGEIRSAVWVPN